VATPLGTIEAAASAAGARVEQGFNEAAAVVSNSNTVERIEKSTAPAREAMAKNLAKAKKSAKKRIKSATKRASAAKKSAKKRVGVGDDEGHQSEEGGKEGRRVREN